MSETREETLNRLLEQSRALDSDLGRCRERCSGLEMEQGRLRIMLREMESGQGPYRVEGLQVGRVSGGAPKGEPAAQDAQGRVPVKLGWDGDGQNLMARVAAPWNHAKGGVSFHPRNGELVYLAFEESRPELPVIVGYHPTQNDSLTYNPMAESPQGVLASARSASDQAYNPLTGNQYKSVIGSKSPGAAGVSSEIAFNDHPGQESLNLGSQGEVRLYSQGDYHLKVEGDSVSGHLGDLSRRVEADSGKTVEKNLQRQVGGDLHSVITGNKNETVIGDYTFEVPGQYSQKVLHGKSVYSFTKSGEWAIFLGGSNTIVAGEDVEAYAALLVRGFVLSEDFYLGVCSFLSARKDAWAASANNNQLAAIRNRLVVIKNAAAAADKDVAKVDDSNLTVNKATTIVHSFATDLFDGFKIDT